MVTRSSLIIWNCYYFHDTLVRLVIGLFIVAPLAIVTTSNATALPNAPKQPDIASMSSVGAASRRVARAAIAQLCSTRDKHANLINVAKCAGWAKAEGASMLFLPECLGFMGDNAGHTLDQAEPAITMSTSAQQPDSSLMSPFRRELADVIDSHASLPKNDADSKTSCTGFMTRESVRIIEELQFIAKRSQLWISGGGIHTSVPVPLNDSASGSTTPERKIYNTHVIIDDEGQIKCYYHKIHLFDVSIPNKVNLRESKTTAPGEKLVACDSPLGKLGVTICYDVRFSEMYVDLVQKGGAQILLVPSAFTVPTGKAHWHALLKARAIESQCYVIAAAQVGKHNDRRESYGHSVAYDPWGELLCDAGGCDGNGTSDSIGLAPSIIVCEVDIDHLESVRERMPVQKHRENSSFSF